MLNQEIFLNPRGALVARRPSFAGSAVQWRVFVTPLSVDVQRATMPTSPVCPAGVAGMAGNLDGIGGTYAAGAATGKARSTEQDLFHLMNRRDSRPWRPPH
jgi:hypothetical protein